MRSFENPEYFIPNTNIHQRQLEGIRRNTLNPDYSRMLKLALGDDIIIVPVSVVEGVEDFADLVPMTPPLIDKYDACIDITD